MYPFGNRISALNPLLDRIDEIIAGGSPCLDARAPQVSAWNVRQQVDHSLKVLDRISRTLEERKLVDGPGPSRQGHVVLLFGIIPRGRAKSPESVLPEERDAPQLSEATTAVRKRLAELEHDKAFLCEHRRFFRHPFLGSFSPAQALRFLEVHTSHHLKIVNDITAKTR